jgi:glycosyltransferase involved in cell wall biosynthesis
MCVYGNDNPDWFSIAVESVLNQSHKPDQVVLVVDGPVPEVLEKIISKFEAMDFFLVIRLEVNQGQGNARRIGLENCSYDLVALMDADDISVPDRFEKQIKTFEDNPKLDIVGGFIAEFVGNPDNIIGKRVVPKTNQEIKVYLKKRCPMNQVTVMFRKSSVDQVGGYIDWYCEEDYYLWLRMFLADMNFVNLGDILVNVRVGKEMYQRRGGWRYFMSEAKLQKYMLKNKIIGIGTYFINVTVRLILQVLLPNKVRGWIFIKFARRQA